MFINKNKIDHQFGSLFILHNLKLTQSEILLQFLYQGVAQPFPQGSTLMFCHHTFNHWPRDTYYLWLMMFTSLLEIRVLGKFSVRFQVTCVDTRLWGYFPKFPGPFCQIAKATLLFFYLAILPSWLYKLAKSTLPNCKNHFVIFLFDYFTKFAKSTLSNCEIHIAQLSCPYCHIRIPKLPTLYKQMAKSISPCGQPKWTSSCPRL